MVHVGLVGIRKFVRKLINYGGGLPAAKPFSEDHLTVARRRPVRLLRGEADELAIARALI